MNDKKTSEIKALLDQARQAIDGSLDRLSPVYKALDALEKAVAILSIRES